MNSNFTLNFASQEKKARKLLLEKHHFPAEKLALMTTHEIEKFLEDQYVVYKHDYDWLLIHKDNVQEFNSIAIWLDR